MNLENLNVLVVSGRLPTEEHPGTMTFVRSQSESLRKLGVNVRYFEIVGPKRTKYLKAIPQINRLCRKEKIDLIHAHHGFSGIAARFQLRIPLIVSFMGDELLMDVDFKGQPLLTSRIWYRIFWTLANVVNAVIVKSDEMASKLRQKNVFVIPNGVDFKKFKPIDKLVACKILGLNPDRRYILFPADPDRSVKGFHLAEEAVNLLNQRINQPVELLKLRKVAPSIVPLMLNAADLILLTSYSEGSPNVIKESMACGLPIIATDVGDIRQVIGRTDRCHVVQRDPYLISSFLEEELKLSNGRTTGRDNVKHLELEQVARGVLAVYHKVINDKFHK